MIIKKIKLNNIRSYKNQEIEFPKGSTLLSGNIGSGKSTILLAVDFALFGITRETPGNALLRSGEDQGSIELHFNLNNQNIIIKRTLKRTPVSVAQNSGYIIIDDQKQELTAMELKQKILEILNYPSELLTKTKSLIYNYTVYSPQEKMKEILLSTKEHRLEILRKVFGIDKYKKVRNNTEIFITALKQKTKEIAAKVADLEQKEEELAERKQKSNELKTELTSLTPQIEKAQNLITEQSKEIEILDTKIKETQQTKHEIEKTTISIEHKTQENQQLNETIEKLSQEIYSIEQELKKLPELDPHLQDKIISLEQEIKSLEEQNLHSQKRTTELETRKFNHEKLCNEINSLDHCPVCKQDVEDDHKHNLSKEHAEKIEKINLELMALERSLKQNAEVLESKKEKISQIQNSITNQKLVEIKLKDQNSKKQQLQESKTKQENLKREILTLNKTKIELSTKIKEQPDLEKNLQIKKQEVEILSQTLKEVEIKKASHESEFNTLQSIIQILEKEVEDKRTSKTNIIKLQQIREWLEKQFINITSIMEKNIMLRVHSELESLIQKWFFILVNTEAIKIHLDEEFTPIIEQNNHEIDYIHLSGGEKTAAALSYRLALNQVINTLMSTINTRDILMLDEPTDGFSNEQIDRMRNILEELNTQQTIIVSHDPKIESFVDNVIRLEKIEHSTEILKQ